MSLDISTTEVTVTDGEDGYDLKIRIEEGQENKLAEESELKQQLEKSRAEVQVLKDEIQVWQMGNGSEGSSSKVKELEKQNELLKAEIEGLNQFLEQVLTKARDLHDAIQLLGAGSGRGEPSSKVKELEKQNKLLKAMLEEKDKELKESYQKNENFKAVSRPMVKVLATQHTQASIEKEAKDKELKELRDRIQVLEALAVAEGK